MNFVFLSLQRINIGRESTSTGLARELSRNHKVLYVNPSINRKTRLSKNNDKYTAEHIQQIEKKKNGLMRLNENLYSLNTSCTLESINWLPSTAIFSFFNKLNNQKLAAEIKKALEKLNIEEFILINDKDIFNSFYLKELLSPTAYIYLDRDNTVAMNYWRRHGTKLEPLLIAKSDAVICNSYDFERKAKKYNKNSFYVGNGVDLKLFDPTAKYEVPAELKDIPKPIIGYVGALISFRLDIDLLINTVKLNPDKSFVLIGLEDDNFANSELHLLPNVHFTGKLHKDMVPAYVNCFDVCINPQVVNEITIGNFPLKVVEYLAMGKPVVAVQTNTMNELFKDVTYIAKTQQEFCDLLEKAVFENTIEKINQRVSFAKQFDWGKVAKNVLNVIDKIYHPTESHY